MENINITMNDHKLSVPSGSTILEAATANGIKIPTLCYLKGIDARANCRMCVVEIENNRTFQPACATKVSEGMEVQTDTPAVRKSRKLTLELFLSRHAVDCHHCMRIGSSKSDDLDPKFCEMCFFCDCVRDGFCELQALAREYKVDYLPFEIESNTTPLDTSTGSVIRNPNKCIKCCRCVDVCNDIQTVHNLCVVNRGSGITVMPEMGKSMAESPCVQCGRCADVCPTGAIFMLEHMDEMLYNTHIYGVTTVAQLSSSVYEELTYLFKMEPGKETAKLVAAGLRKIGVDYVVTDDFAFAVSSAEAETVLGEAVKSATGPLIITNDYAARKFVKKNFPDMEGKLFIYASAQQQFGKYVKTVFAQEKKLVPASIRTIYITSENENAADTAENKTVDFTVNARELYRIFLRTGVNLNKRRPVELDSLGTVCEVNELFAPVRWSIKGEVKELDLSLGGKTVKAAVTSNLGQARQLLTELQNGSSKYDLIRINA